MQTITVPTSRINQRVFALLVATALLAVMVTLAVTHYVHSSSSHAITPAPARLAPLTTSSFGFTSCPLHGPC